MRPMWPWIVLLVAGTAWGAGSGELTIQVVDKQTGQPVPFRMHLKNAAGVPRKVPRLPFWHDHFVAPGEVLLQLPSGNYTFEIEHGPEYANWTGHFRMVDFGGDAQTVPLVRGVDMAAEGWWSGDLNLSRRPEDLNLLLEADGLHVVGVPTWSDTKPGSKPPAAFDRLLKFDGPRFADLSAGRVGAKGAQLTVLNTGDRLSPADDANNPWAVIDRLREARHGHPSLWVDADRPFAWDLPLWLAAGVVDSIGLAHGNLGRERMVTSEEGGRPRPRSEYVDPWGLGVWSHDIYFHVLNCGYRLPPSASSESGLRNNPAGYNRIYVQLPVGQSLEYDAWWQTLRLGRAVVTNGPLIRPAANGCPPGEVFVSQTGDPVELDVAMNLTYLASRDRLGYLELIQNGRVAASLRLEEWKATGHFPPVVFRESGWCLVRVVVDNQQTYRFAVSAPWYVEVGTQPRRVSRRSVQFFLDWLDEWAQQRGTAAAAADPSAAHRLQAVRDFWRQKLAEATAD